MSAKAAVGFCSPELAATLRGDAMPLQGFPEWMLDRINREVSMPEPPNRYRLLGNPEDPYPTAMIESRGWYEWHWQRGIDPSKKRDHLPPHLRLAVIQRDGLTCQLCLRPVAADDIHIDHIKPWSKGGKHELSNLQVTHSMCNMKKGAKFDGA